MDSREFDLAAFYRRPCCRVVAKSPRQPGTREEEVRLASSSGRDSSEEDTQTRISGPRREDGIFRRGSGIRVGQTQRLKVATRKTNAPGQVVAGATPLRRDGRSPGPA